MEKYPLVSIIVINYNGVSHLETCFSSILKSRYPRYEVIFVDNASSDGSVEFVREAYPAVTIIKNTSNLGVGGAFNRGITYAKGKYVALLNNDIEVHPDWLLGLVDFMERSPQVGAVDPKYINYYDRSKFDASSGAGRYLDFLANPVIRGAERAGIGDMGINDCGQYDSVARIFYSDTFFRKSALLDVGLFDEDFFYWYEDSDEGWRLNLRGYQIMYVPTSIIYHKGGEKKFESSDQKSIRLRKNFYFLNKRNKLYVLIKNYSTLTLLRLFPLILFEQSGYVLYWSMKRDGDYSLESLRSLLWVIMNFGRVWTKHLQVQLLRRITDREIFALMAQYSGDPVKLIRSMFHA